MASTMSQLFVSWARTHGKLAMDAANLLQPIRLSGG